MSRAQLRACRENLVSGCDVAPRGADVGTRPDGLLDYYEAVFGAGVLDHADSIGARREHAAGHYAGCLTFANNERPGVVASHERPGNPEPRWHTSDIDGADGVTVHRRIGKRRHRLAGTHRLGKDMADSLHEQGAHRRQPSAARKNEAARIVDAHQCHGAFRISAHARPSRAGFSPAELGWGIGSKLDVRTLQRPGTQSAGTRARRRELSRALRSLLPEATDQVDLVEMYSREVRPPDGRPFVRVNMVSTLDGAIALGGRAGEISGPADRAVFFVLRSLADLVLVGAGTVRAENYGPVKLPEDVQLTRVGRGQSPLPRLAVVTHRVDLDFGSRLFVGSSERPIVIAPGGADARVLAEARLVADVVESGTGDRGSPVRAGHAGGQRDQPHSLRGRAEAQREPGRRIARRRALPYAVPKARSRQSSRGSSAVGWKTTPRPRSVSPSPGSWRSTWSTSSKKTGSCSSGSGPVRAAARPSAAQTGSRPPQHRRRAAQVRRLPCPEAGPLVAAGKASPGTMSCPSPCRRSAR